MVYDIEEAKFSACFFTKRIVTYCEKVSEILGLQYNKNEAAKGNEKLRLVFHKNNSYLL